MPTHVQFSWQGPQARANTFTVEDAVAGLMKPQRFHHEHAIYLYPLLVWARFPDQDVILDAYFAQAALMLGSVRALRPSDELPPAGRHLLAHNLACAKVRRALPGNGDLSLAALAPPPDALDWRLRESRTLFGRQAQLAKFLIGATACDHKLVSREGARLAFERDIMGKGPEFWGSRRGSEGVGPSESAFNNNIWPGDRALLLREFLGLHDLESGERHSANLQDDPDEDGEEDEGTGYLMYGRTCLTRLLAGPTPFASYFRRALDERCLNQIREGLLAYRSFVFKSSSDGLSPIAEKWGGLDRSDLWQGQVLRSLDEVTKSRRFDSQQMKIARSVVADLRSKRPK